jgi:hypothetical protein
MKSFSPKSYGKENICCEENRDREGESNWHLPVMKSPFEDLAFQEGVSSPCRYKFNYVPLKKWRQNLRSGMERH